MPNESNGLDICYLKGGKLNYVDILRAKQVTKIKTTVLLITSEFADLRSIYRNEKSAKLCQSVKGKSHCPLIEDTHIINDKGD